MSAHIKRRMAHLGGIEKKEEDDVHKALQKKCMYVHGTAGARIVELKNT